MCWIQASSLGAYDIKPFEPEELLHRVKNALQQTRSSRGEPPLREELRGSSARQHRRGGHRPEGRASRR
jgi:DNA-binding response OmpR family regulator